MSPHYPRMNMSAKLEDRGLRVEDRTALGSSSIVGRLSSLRRLARRNTIGAIGALIVIGLALVAIFAPLIAPYDPNTQLGPRLTPPNSQYLLGLDQLGRD